jgi:hypothetical protein
MAWLPLLPIGSENAANTCLTSGIILQGGPLTVTNLQIPQRFQLVTGLSSLDAGVRFIPFGVALSVGTITSANMARRSSLPAVYSVIVGALLQVIGFALLASSGTWVEIPAAIYGYLVIAGFGCGVSYQTLMLFIPAAAEKRDHGEHRPLNLAGCERLTTIKPWEWEQQISSEPSAAPSCHGGYIHRYLQWLCLSKAVRDRNFRPQSRRTDIRQRPYRYLARGMECSEGYSISRL